MTLRREKNPHKEIRSRSCDKKTIVLITQGALES